MFGTDPTGSKKIAEDKKGMKGKGKESNYNPPENKGKIVHFCGLVTVKTLGFHHFFQLKQSTWSGQRKAWLGQCMLELKRNNGGSLPGLLRTGAS